MIARSSGIRGGRTPASTSPTHDLAAERWLLGAVPALAQNINYRNPVFAADAAGRVMASEYGEWSITTLSPITAGTSTNNFAPCFVPSTGFR
jgi:hypothetical protein